MWLLEQDFIHGLMEGPIRTLKHQIFKKKIIKPGDSISLCFPISNRVDLY